MDYWHARNKKQNCRYILEESSTFWLFAVTFLQQQRFCLTLHDPNFADCKTTKTKTTGAVKQFQ